MIKKIQHISYCILTTLLMVACQKEELHEGPCKVRFVASVQDEVSVTRDIPEYTSFTPSSDFQAGLYVSYGDTYKEFAIEWNESSLSSTADLEAWTDPYWFYGYAPKISDSNPEKAEFNNADKTLTLSSIPALTTTDWLVIKPCPTKIETTDIGKTKTVSLQMDHLMAKITPRFYLDATYANMRSIRIKTVEFLLPSASYTATVNYNVDEDSDKPYKVEWSVPITAESTTEITTYENEKPEDEQKLVTVDTNEQNYGHCYICPNQATGSLLMRVTYDVYDKVNKETPIRSDEVVNKVIIKQNGTTIDKLTAGNNYILNIKVVPTYLYVLSDNDQGSVLVIPND